MPWDSIVVRVDEAQPDDDMRILAYRRPDEKLVFVVSNRCHQDYTFKIVTGVDDGVFAGYRYHPDDAGTDFGGVAIGRLKGRSLEISVPDLCWEFWVQQ